MPRKGPRPRKRRKTKEATTQTNKKAERSREKQRKTKSTCINYPTDTPHHHTKRRPTHTEKQTARTCADRNMLKLLRVEAPSECRRSRLKDIGRTAAGTDSPTCGESEVPTMVPTQGGGWGRDRSMAWRRPRRRRCASTSAVEEADHEEV